MPGYKYINIYKIWLEIIYIIVNSTVHIKSKCTVIHPNKIITQTGFKVTEPDDL